MSVETRLIECRALNKILPMQIPPLDSLDAYTLPLAQMVAGTSWLPHPDTVRALGRAAFPTVRARKQNPRSNLVVADGRTVGMYDDNTTPRWAFFWAHGIPETAHPSNRTFAHVWEGADDIGAYTHLANLVMVPEPFASLTDKDGPLTGFLRWHAWTVYRWKPTSAMAPAKPNGYDQVRWRYMTRFDRPREFIRDRVVQLKNERVEILRPIMKNLGML